MPGPDRILDSVQKMLEGQAKLQEQVATTLLKAQTQKQILEGQLKLGLLRGTHEAATEAHELQSDGPAPQQATPFSLNLGTAVAEQRLNARDPLQSVDPAQLSSALQAFKQQADAAAASPQGGAPSAAQGLPIGGENITQRTQEFGLSPERVGQQGFVLVPSASERTTSTPNVLTASDLLTARQREQEHADQLALEKLKADRSYESQQLASALTTRKALLDTAEVARQQGLSPQESVELQNAVRLGDSEAVGRLTAGRKTIEDKANEALIRLRDAQAAEAKRQATELGFKLTPGQEATDREFGKFVGLMSDNGGFERANTNLNVLNLVIQELEANKGKRVGLTGPALAALPAPVRAFANPEAQNARDLVAGIVRQSARQILGAQYTQQEGENLVSEAYNLSLEEKFNVDRLKRFRDTVQERINENRDRYDYFTKNGTLQGFKGAEKPAVTPTPPPDEDFTQLTDEQLRAIAGGK